MSKIIRSEDLADCQTWLVPEVKHGAGAARTRPLTARQLEEIQARARQEGYQEGLREGREAGMKEMQAHIRTLESLVNSLDKPFTELDDAVETQLAELAMLVTRQLVRRELKTEPEQVIAVMREALSALPVAARNVRLLLHPDDGALVRDTLSLGEGSERIRIVDDPVMTRGGCRVLSDSSQIDATVEARLNAMISHVLGGRRSGDGGSK